MKFRINDIGRKTFLIAVPMGMAVLAMLARLLLETVTKEVDKSALGILQVVAVSVFCLLMVLDFLVVPLLHFRTIFSVVTIDERGLRATIGRRTWFCSTWDEILACGEFQTQESAPRYSNTWFYFSKEEHVTLSRAMLFLNFVVRNKKREDVLFFQPQYPAEVRSQIDLYIGRERLKKRGTYKNGKRIR